MEFVADGDGLAVTITLHNGRIVDLGNVSFDSLRVHFEYAGGEVIYDGELEGETISGEVMEVGEYGSFTLTRME